MEAESGGVSAGQGHGRFGGTGRQVEPLTFAVEQGWQANPIQNGVFILVEVKDNRGGRAVEKKQSPLPAFALHRKAPDPMAGQARQGCFAVGQGKHDQIHQPFACAGQVAPESEQALSMLAEGRQPNCRGSAIGPDEVVAFVVNAVFDTVAGRISAE